MTNPAAVVIALSMATPLVAQDVTEPKTGVTFAAKDGQTSLIGVVFGPGHGQGLAIGLYVADSALSGPLTAYKGRPARPSSTESS